jgi:hypothetical protein
MQQRSINYLQIFTKGTVHSLGVHDWITLLELKDFAYRLVAHKDMNVCPKFHGGVKCLANWRGWISSEEEDRAVLLSLLVLCRLSYYLRRIDRRNLT